MGKSLESEKANLLDILTEIRTVTALDTVLNSNKTYQKALKQQDKAFNKMEKIGLNEKQHTVADKALSAVNHCGAVYGAIAYRLGLQDGIKIASELREIE